MIISTRGRYALRVMTDLAERDAGTYTAMREIAQRQEISLKYLEKILPALVSGGLIEGVHGKGGGYRLRRTPEQITAGEILRLTEGDLSPVSCVSGGDGGCRRLGDCRTHPLWEGLNDAVNRYLDGVTLADLTRHP